MLSIMFIPKEDQEANDDRFCRQKRFQIINWQNGPVKITTKGVEPRRFE